MSRLDWRSDSAESSVMQVVALAVSVILATSIGSFMATNLRVSDTLQSEDQAQIDSMIANRYFANDTETARSFTEATDTHMQFVLDDGRCVTYGLQLDSKRHTTLVRTTGGCGNEVSILPSDKVLLTNLSAGTSFSFRNIAGLPIENGHVTGTCDSFYLPIECSSTVPFVVRMTGMAKNPVTGNNALVMTGTTDAVRLTMQADGNSDVEAPETIPGDMEPVSP